MKLIQNIYVKYVFPSLFFGVLFLTTFAYSQTELHTPYPIIFVHGLNGNYTTWYGTPGSFDNVIDYLEGGNTALVDGGTLNVTLDYKRDNTSFSNTKEEDVHLYTTPNYKFGDFYTINFDVHSDGTDLSNISGITSNELVGNVSSVLNTFTVNKPSIFKVGDILRIDDEFMQVTNKSGKLLTVNKPILGSQSANHFNGDGNRCWNISNESNQASIVKQGYALKLAIDAVKLKTKASKVILVGHSMGGLAIREYLRSYYNNDVAKVVTIGTPHLGSNATEISSLGNEIVGIDYRSDAIRDLMYNYSGIDGNPQPPYGDSPDNSIYLFGGDSELFLASETNFYNPDVNANGIIDNNIQPGLNTDMLKTLPNSVSYSWIISQWVPNGDGAVLYQRQFPWFEYGSSGGIKAIGNIIKTNKLHIDEPTDYYSLLRGLDEPDNQKLAYKIGENSTNKGFITYQQGNYETDVDLYKLILNKQGLLKINLLGNSFTGIKTIKLLDSNLDEIKYIIDINGIIEEDVKPGTYYIQIYGIATKDSYKYPYTLITHFTETAPAILAVSQSSLNYYDVLLNTPKNKTITLTNNGSTNVSISSIALTDTNADQFSVAPLPPLLITPGASLDETVTFNPTSIDLKNATLTINTNATENPSKTIILAGNGVDHSTKVLSSIPSSSYIFDNTKVGQSRNKIITLKNTGSSICTVSDISIEGSNPYNFNIASQPTLPFNIATGDTKQITIQFKPTSEGSKNVSLAITNNSDNFSPKLAINLYGDGLGNAYSGTNNILTNYEYWYDNNYNAKTSTVVNSFGDFILDTQFNTDQLIIGLHSLHIRYKDKKGKWSSVISKFFYKSPNSKALPRKVIASEYWFDDDYSSNVSTHITPTNTDSINIGLDVNSLTQGLHSYHVRYKDDDGKWSSVISKFFYKSPNSKALPRKVTTSEYWFDDDYLSNVSTPITPSSMVSINIGLDVNSLTQGLHSYHVRYKDDDGKWSSIMSKFFYKLPVGSSKITSYRYWVNNDFINAVYVNVSNPIKIFNLSKDIDVSNFVNGDYSINFQFKDSKNQWSSVLTKNFTFSTLSVIENTFKKNILVYPNPTNGVVYLDLGSAYGKVDVKFFDVNGRIIKEKLLAGIQKFSFDISFPSGIYYMIITAEGKKAIFKIIKY